jgi:hypothetical protein
MRVAMVGAFFNGMREQWPAWTMHELDLNELDKCFRSIDQHWLALILTKQHEPCVFRFRTARTSLNQQKPSQFKLGPTFNPHHIKNHPTITSSPSSNLFYDHHNFSFLALSNVFILAPSYHWRQRKQNKSVKIFHNSAQKANETKRQKLSPSHGRRISQANLWIKKTFSASQIKRDFFILSPLASAVERKICMQMSFVPSRKRERSGLAPRLCDIFLQLNSKD